MGGSYTTPQHNLTVKSLQQSEFIRIRESVSLLQQWIQGVKSVAHADESIEDYQPPLRIISPVENHCAFHLIIAALWTVLVFVFSAPADSCHQKQSNGL